MIEEETVKYYSKKRYNCKRNKGEHDFGEPQVTYKPQVLYIYDTGSGVLHSHRLLKEYKYLRTEIHLAFTTTCKVCGHKAVSFLVDKIK